MSQTLDLSLKRKNNSDIYVCLCWYSTSWARELGTEGIFPYTEEKKLLRVSDLDKVMNDLKKRLEELTSHREKEAENLVTYSTLVEKCTSKEAVQELIDNINDCRDSIKSWDEDIKDWESIMQTMQFVRSVVEENELDWDLYYYNC